MALLFLPLCLLTGLPGTRTKSSQQTPGVDNSGFPSITVTVPPTTTKWWIKSSTTSSSLSTSITSPGTVRPDDCSGFSEANLRAETYAYIAPFPSIPNRVRSEPMLSSAFLGQVNPGKGVKVIDGPICSDGHSWWFIEAVEGEVRGWTVGGKGREHWILPCPNTGTACAVNLSTAPSLPTQRAPQRNSYCQSERLAAGMVARVRHDTLLVLRRTPFSGEVIGHAGPLSQVKILKGPTCAGGAIWWEVYVSDGQMIGWATEMYLEPS